MREAIEPLLARLGSDELHRGTCKAPLAQLLGQLYSVPGLLQLLQGAVEKGAVPNPSGIAWLAVNLASQVGACVPGDAARGVRAPAGVQFLGPGGRPGDRVHEQMGWMPVILDARGCSCDGHGHGFSWWVVQPSRACACCTLLTMSYLPWLFVKKRNGLPPELTSD